MKVVGSGVPLPERDNNDNNFGLRLSTSLIGATSVEYCLRRPWKLWWFTMAAMEVAAVGEKRVIKVADENNLGLGFREHVTRGTEGK